jgi:pyruvate/2-oxoglutarate/acetoin dehydrogenase E1 component/TPP-dependent pyruvate/acetoin dehydrogenase alpha subunit
VADGPGAGKDSSNRKTVATPQDQLPNTADLSRDDILSDYRIAYLSRQMSVVARREVHAGRAKFGIFGDGKEIAQVALARAFQAGDWRSGYYRDQTLMMALGLLTPTEYFAQLYAHADVEADPASGGRSMGGHFGSRLLDERGKWKSHMERPNSSADVSPTGEQMPRLVGLGYASRIYRELESLHSMTEFSHQGNEVVFGTIGNASCAEGLFWESLNAIGVLQAPVVVSIWDDGYGISVPNELQVLGGNLTQLLQGFRRRDDLPSGYHLHTVRGWDYEALLSVYRRAADNARHGRIPAIVHVIEMTQPQGHSTSGSHERYKPKERLEWEVEFDPIKQMRAWMIEQGIATDDELDTIQAELDRKVFEYRDEAWDRNRAEPLREAAELADLVEEAAGHSARPDELGRIAKRLRALDAPLRKGLVEAGRSALMWVRTEGNPAAPKLARWNRDALAAGRARFGRWLTSESDESPLRVEGVAPRYAADPEQVRGFELLNQAFDAMLARDPRLMFFGEDVGQLGGVNASLTGLQEKYGPLRVGDTGIREATIVGQAVGLAVRGLRPIAEIQYLDYILYAIQVLSDDLAMTQWRSAGGQKAPAIIRTRGHRLEGIWHSGSPMAALLGLLRGMHVLVPRDMTRAIGFYNTLLKGDDPALVIEVLNGYRLREPLPENLSELTVPLGRPEVLRAGSDVTLVTYGACCRVAEAAADLLAEADVEVEIIDVQSLLPFDIDHSIVESLRKTSRLVVLDEDVPGGASAFITQQVLEVQGGFVWLDAAPRTITAQEHRPAYGSDGDFFSKPGVEDVFNTVYDIMHEADPGRYPRIG